MDWRGLAWARSARRGAVLAVLCAALAANPAPAQDVYFEDLPTGDLVEMHGAIGRELSRRGVYAQQFDPTSAYARWLFRNAYNLRIDPTGQADAVDEAGQRYAIIGLRLGGSTTIPALDPRSFDRLGVALFTSDHRLQRAGVIPIGGVIDLLEAGAVIPAGPGSPFWRLPSLEDVTPDIYLQATNFDIANPG